MPTDPKNAALAKGFSEALDKTPNYTPRELDALKESNPAWSGYDELRKARDDARRAYENGRDVHIAASRTKDGYLPGTSREDVGYIIPDAQRKYAKHFIDEVSTPQEFDYTNARRVALGMKPLDIPNPLKAEMKPKEMEKPPVEGLQKPVPPAPDMAQQGGGKPISYDTIPKDKRL